MDFEWDERKNQLNIEKHGINFDTAKKIFEGPVLTWADDRKNYGEIREISLGKVEGQVLLTVAHTGRNEYIRTISARVASQKERRTFEDAERKNALRNQRPRRKQTGYPTRIFI